MITSLTPALADQGLFEASQTALFRDALGFAWANFAKLYAVGDAETVEASGGETAGR